MRLFCRFVNRGLTLPPLRATRPLPSMLQNQLAFEQVFKESGAWDYVLLKAYDQGLRWAGVYSLF